jgi:ferrous iron transport protein B
MPEILTLALAGNPNSGKTTMFNALTGSRQHVGNYPGVTVAKKEGRLQAHGAQLRVVDLPGTYSLTAYSEEELAARNFLVEERPDAVVDIADANILERSLYLAVQVLELGTPLVLVLNMMDEVKRRGITIDTRLLSERLGVPVVETVARAGIGKEELVRTAVEHARTERGSREPLRISYSADIDYALAEMSGLIEEHAFLTDRLPARWVALKYLEGDEQVMEMGAKQGEPHGELVAVAERLAEHLDKTLNTYPEAVISDYRYGFIASMLRRGVIRRETSRDRIETSDRIDRVVTHPLLGPVLMLAVLYGMFQATFALGETPMGWLEAFFAWLSGGVEGLLPPGPLRSLIVSGVIDGVGGVLGFVPLIAIMFVMLSFLEDLGYMARMAYMLDRIFKTFGLHGSSVMPFIISGGIPGGCAVPGVMAARTLRSPKERLATILVTPFMACGAKIPVFILLAGAFFPGSAGTALFWVTLGAWAVALIVAKVLRSTVIRGESTPFLMELPPYRMPTLKGVLIHTWERAWQYIKKAGTIILAISIILWAAMSWPNLPEDRAREFDTRAERLEERLEAAANIERAAEIEDELRELMDERASADLKASLAGRIGAALEPVTSLAGFDWRTNVALVGGFAAKEVIVSTLGTSYSLGQTAAEEERSLSERLKRDPDFTLWTAVSLMTFVVLYAPCFVTVVTIARETSWGWAGFAMVFNTLLGFALAAGIYQIGTSV